jgi:2-methylcitrate dehydratase PrpD
MTLTQQLICLIRNKPIGQCDLERAAIFTLDAIANTLAGCNSAPGKILLQWGAGQGGDAGRKAFVAGGLTHILETDDLHRASVTHPGCVVVPAVFALAEREGSSGRDMLNAILHGFEAMCRVGIAVGPEHYRIWHNTATCGPFGSAMAATALLGLSDDQAMNALGNAGTQSSGLWEFLATGAMSKHLHAGRAAEAGIVAADLAVLGFTGPPAILEGEKAFFVAACADAKPGLVNADPDAPWQLNETSIKPWPSRRLLVDGYAHFATM